MTKLEFWERYLRAYDAVNLIDQYRAYQDELASRLCTSEGLAILDAGSGTGNLSIRMRALGAKVTSLDFSAEALAIHRAKDPEADQVRTTLEEPLPFGEGSFDRIVCASVLFALSEQGVQQALREFRRVLRAGGRLLVTASRKKMSLAKLAAESLAAKRRGRSLRQFAREVLSILEPMLRLLYYTLRIRRLRRQQGYRRFSEEELADAVRRAGFRHISLGRTFGGHFHTVEAVT